MKIVGCLMCGRDHEDIEVKETEDTYRPLKFEGMDIVRSDIEINKYFLCPHDGSETPIFITDEAIFGLLFPQI